MTSKFDQCVLVAAVCSGLIVGGCYAPPSTEESIAESIVGTRFSEDADFTSYGSFFIRPEIRILDERSVQIPGQPSEEPTFISSSVAKPLLDETRKNLKARGYTEVTDPATADLGVELAYVRVSTTSYYCYYWGDWYYWGYPGYGYYPPYPCSSSTWRSGTLVTHIVDLAEAVSGAPVAPDGGIADAGFSRIIGGLWSSGVYGVEIESSSYVTQRAVSGIDQAFEQSPYLTNSP